MKLKLKNIIVLILLAFVTSSAKAYDFKDYGIYYNVASLSDFTCEVTSGDTEYEGNIVIPTEVTYKSKTLKVVRIGSSAFEACTRLTEIELPESLTDIEDYAFYCCISLTSIKWPESLTDIGYLAFYGCTSLTSIKLPESLTKIGNSAFYRCTSLSKIELPESLTEIEKYAFADTKLTTINFGPNLKTLEYGTFKNCHFESLTIPETIEEIIVYGTDGYGINYCFTNVDKLRIENSDKQLLTSYLDCYGNNIKNPKKYKITINDFFEPLGIKQLYLDRELDFGNDRNFFLPALEKITIGKNMTTLLGFENCSNLKRIVCEGAVPPDFYSYSNNFTKDQYMDLEVLVPLDALEAYKQHEVWKNFWNLKGDPELAGIDSVIDQDAEKTEIGRYDLSGRPVTGDYDGMVIVRYSDGSSQKIISRK